VRDGLTDEVAALAVTTAALAAANGIVTTPNEEERC